MSPWESRDIARRLWRRRQHECYHPHFNIVEIDGREYGICVECQWLCNGSIARANNLRFE